MTTDPATTTDSATTRDPASTTDRVLITTLSTPRDVAEVLAQDVREGLLSGERKQLPPKYFYDAAGSQLFEQITELEEYYPTRAEAEVLERIADDVVGDVGPEQIVELGSGSSRKTRLLLEAMHRAGTGSAYVPLDVSADALSTAARELVADYPWLRVHGYVGDFHTDLAKVPHPRGRRLVAFLGSTIGNFPTDVRVELLREVRTMLAEDDRLLVGLDLVKAEQVLVAAYDDAAGVTAAFNRNMLRNVNAIAGSDFDPDDFDHQAAWVADCACIELRLVARRDLEVRFPALDAVVTFAEGEHLLTEHSCKFTRPTAQQQLAAAGLAVERWEEDAAGRFAVAVVRPA